MSKINTLQVRTQQASAALTAPQKRFNTLLRQIEQTRQSLTGWQDGIAVYREAHARLLLPLQTELLEGRRRWVQALDEQLDRRSWTRVERETLRELLCDAAAELLSARGDDAALKSLFDKHADVDFDTEQREAMRAMKEMAESMTGLDLGEDEGLNDEADLLARMQQGLQEQVAAEAAQRSAQAPKRRKSAAQQRRETEAEQATQSMRDIFRKLASTLHPDREPDEQQRQAKTAMMQRVNQAYAANDLLSLLELQLEIEQIDANHMAGASEQRLRHYNKVLGDQLAELRAEVQRVEMGFRMEFGLQPGWGLNPARLGEVLEQVKRQWHADLAEQQRDLRMLGDPAATKRWLKRQRQALQDEAFGFNPF